MFTSGCVTNWVMEEYGKSASSFKTTGPVHGDVTQIFAQGMLSDLSGESRGGERPAYMHMTIYKGEEPGKTIHEGALPPAAFEYPQIPQIPYSEFKTRAEVFAESGEEIASVGDWTYLFIQNPDNAANPAQIWMGAMKPNPLPLWAKITYPFVIVGAVAADTAIFTSVLVLLVYASSDDL